MARLSFPRRIQTTFLSAIAGGVFSAPLIGRVPLTMLTITATANERIATASDTEINPRPLVIVRRIPWTKPSRIVSTIATSATLIAVIADEVMRWPRLRTL